MTKIADIAIKQEDALDVIMASGIIKDLVQNAKIIADGVDLEVAIDVIMASGIIEENAKNAWRIADIAEEIVAIYAKKDLLRLMVNVKNVLKIVTDVIQKDAITGVVL